MSALRVIALIGILTFLVINNIEAASFHVVFSGEPRSPYYAHTVIVGNDPSTDNDSEPARLSSCSPECESKTGYSYSSEGGKRTVIFVNEGPLTPHEDAEVFNGRHDDIGRTFFGLLFAGVVGLVGLALLERR